MSEVVTFLDMTPPARFDGNPWTDVVIDEAALSAGPWSPIDTIALTPADTDPTTPSARSFTTTAGTDDDRWYRVRFVDADGNVSEPSAPIQDQAAPPITSYAGVDELARVLRLTNVTDEQVTAMQRVLEAARREIDSEIGTTYVSPYPPLLVEVNLERAVEHWQQAQSPFGIVAVGGDTGLAYSARDSWDRHAHKLAPYKLSWGFA